MSARARNGFTLIEIIVAITVATLVMGAVYRVLVNNQRFYRAQTEIVTVQQNVRQVAQILPGEFRELAASDSDIVAMDKDSITIKAMRGISFVCAPPVPAAGTVIIRSSLTFGYRNVDITRDSALVFRDGNTAASSDDRWLHSAISATNPAALCSDGERGTQLTLTGMSGGLAQLDSVTEGSPVRTFEVVTYRIYEDEGLYWLGVRNYVGGSWTDLSPIAGPLRSDGLAFRYFDGDGIETPDPVEVVLIELTARGQSERPINVQGRTAGQYQDSVTVRVALRNN